MQMVLSRDGFDLATYEGQIANIKAVRRRIAEGRIVKGGTTLPRPTPELTLTQNLDEGASVALECSIAVESSAALASLSEICDRPSPSVVKMARPFDYVAFRTEALDGEEAPERLAFPQIARLVGRELGMDPVEIWGPSRGAQHCFARHAAWWLAKHWTSLSFPQIGRLSTCKSYCHSTGKDHSTVVHGVKKFDAWRAGAARYYHVPPYAEWEAHRGE